MTTEEIANKLVAYCRAGKYKECYEELYDLENVESIEPKGAMNEYCKGMEQLQKKGEAWNAMMEELHESTVGEPICSKDHFCVPMSMEATFKGMGRERMDELCVYEIKNGKIVKEQFFYHIPQQT